jgi:hypothetical protein
LRVLLLGSVWAVNEDRRVLLLRVLRAKADLVDQGLLLLVLSLTLGAGTDERLLEALAV